MKSLNSPSNDSGWIPFAEAKRLRTVRSLAEKELETTPPPSGHAQSSEEERAFTNIVVAYNGSRESKRALESAVRLARITGATLQTITVLKCLPAYTAYAMAAIPSAPVILKRDLHEACAKLQEDAREIALKAGVDVVTHLVEGDDVESIITFISETGADLLVIGIHKRQLRLSSLWSTAYDLAQHAPCSVLGVPYQRLSCLLTTRRR